MLSLTCKTAVKAVIYLAMKFESEHRSGVAEISEHIDASGHTVGKLLQTLVKAEIICSSKGPKGGFYITEKQKNQTVIKIVDAIDGKDVFNQCGLGLSRCSAAHPCPIHNDFKLVRDGFEELCRQKKIRDLCENVNQGFSYLFG
jgi:Rrf2 family protein